MCDLVGNPKTGFLVMWLILSLIEIPVSSVDLDQSLHSAKVSSESTLLA